MKIQLVHLSVMALTVALSGCGQPPQEATSVRPALVRKAQPGATADADVYTGEVRARYEADLGFRVGGKITSRRVDVGSVVRRGDVLATIDPADAALNAEAAAAQVAAAETEFSFASAELERYKSLLAKQFISQAVFDTRLNAYNSAKAQLDRARSQYDLARNQSSYTTLRAEQDGVVTAVSAEAGQVVAAGQAVLRLSRPEEKEVVISVPESRANELRGAPTLSVSLWADRSRTYHGRLRELSPNADPATRTFTAKISVLEPGDEVRLGMTANVIVGARTVASRAVLMPLTAVTRKGDQALVWVVDPASGKVSARPVSIGRYREDGVLIASGLTGGELVVVAGAHTLVAGQQVRPVEQADTVARQ